MSHVHHIEDDTGDIVDLVYFCSDTCHNDWCNIKGNPDYGGWNGCHEHDCTETCAHCGEILEGIEQEQEA